MRLELSLQILLSLTAMICFLGGLNLLIKGAGYFLPKNTSPQLILDNLIRFLSGIYFSMSFLLAWGVFNIRTIHELVYFLGIPIVFSGLGRLYSRIKVGSAGKYFDFIMLFEILLGIAVIVLEYLR